MNKTSIEWTDYTSNPIRARNLETGKPGHFCEVVSPGCAHCYSSDWNENRYGTGLAFRPANRDKVEVYLHESEFAEWLKPKYVGSRVFVCDMTDLFGEWVSDQWLYRIFEAMGAASLVTFQVLTKRPERAQKWIGGIHGKGWPLPNVWLGVSVENERWCWDRVSDLIATPATIRFVSYEPALGPVSFRGMLGRHYLTVDKSEPGYGGMKMSFEGIDWLICGGESGLKRRPFNPDWARSARDQCKAAGAAFFMKQQGGRFPGNKLEELPPDLRVREFPA